MEEPLDFLARQAQELNMGYDMSKIKTPEEFYRKVNNDCEIPDIPGEQFFTPDQMIWMAKAYSEYRIKAVIEELEGEKPPQLISIGRKTSWLSGVKKAIEILKSRI